MSDLTINLTNVQETLVSGTNIKTINGDSLLGSGDLAIASLSVGTDGQIPFTNAAGDDFDYSSNLVFDGTNLGIGTASALKKLDVVGDIRVGESTIGNGSALLLQTNATLGGRFIAYSVSGGANVVFNGDADSYILGNVGIGESTITARLHVKGSGTTSATTALLVENSSGTDLLKIRDDGYVTFGNTTSGNQSYNFFSGGGNTLSLYSDGSVDSSSAFKMYINGGALGSVYSEISLNNSYSSNAYRGAAIALDTRSGIKPMRFMIKDGGSNPFEAMGIDTDGNVGIGTTSPNYKLHAQDGTVSELVFNSGAAGLTPTLAVGNTNPTGKFGALVAGTAGCSFVYDSNGFFTIGKQSKANYTNGTISGGTTILTLRNDNLTIGNGFTDLGARLGVKGAGTTSATTALLVEDSSGDELLKVTDDGAAYLSGYTQNTTLLHLSGNTNGGDNVGFIFNMFDNNQNLLEYARITAFNYDRTFGARKGQLKFYTFENGSRVEAMDIVGSNVGIGATTPSARLHVKGSGTTSATTNLLLQNSSGTDLLKVTDSGQVGIGDVTPAIKGLTIETRAGVANDSSYGIRFNAASGNSAIIYQVTPEILRFKGSSSNYIDIQAQSIGQASSWNIGKPTSTEGVTIKGQGGSVNTSIIDLVASSGLSNTTSELKGLRVGFSINPTSGSNVIIDAAIGGGLAWTGATGWTGKAIGLLVSPNIGDVAVNSATERILLDVGYNTSNTPNYSSHTSVFKILKDGNVGIGATSPSATLHVKGSGTTSATTALLVENSSGTDLFSVSDDGSVGFGTDDPFAKMHINAELDGNNTTLSNQSLIIHQVSSSVATEQKTIAFGQSTNSGIWGGKIAWECSGNYSRGGFKFYTKNAVAAGGPNIEAMVIDMDGNVGIGATPSARLHVKGEGITTSTTNLLLQNSAGGELFSVNDAGTLNVRDNMAYRNNTIGGICYMDVGNMVIRDGNSGINASLSVGVGGTPSATLHVKGSGTTSATTALLVENSSGTDLLKVLDNGQVEILAYRLKLPVIQLTGGANLIEADGGTLRIQTIRGSGTTGSLAIRRGSNDKIYFQNSSGIQTDTWDSAGLGVGATTIDASAKLQVDSTTQGLLPPRMTTTQKNAISSPANGLVVYDTTTNKHCGYNGTIWNDLY